MTLREFLLLLKRYAVLAICIVLVCTVAGGAYALLSDKEDKYQAEAKIAANSQAQGVAGIATAISEQWLDEREQLVESTSGPKTIVKVSTDTPLLTVTVSAESTDVQDAIDVANQIAVQANEAAIQMYSQFEDPYVGTVVQATTADDIEKSSAKKFLVLGFGAGLVLACAVVVLIQLKKRMIISAEEVANLTELPMLERLPAKNGERLLANVLFASAKASQHEASALGSVLILPLGDEKTAEKAQELLQSAFCGGTPTFGIECARPLSETIEGAYRAREVDTVMITVRQWTDNLHQLDNCISELQLAGANVAGFVFCKK